MPRLNSAYKNTLTQLRKKNSVVINNSKLHIGKNIYNTLQFGEIEEPVEDDEPPKKRRKISGNDICLENTKIKFNDLPEDAIFRILEYLPLSKRIAILKHKFSKKNVKHQLQHLPINIDLLCKIGNCANRAHKLLRNIISGNSPVFHFNSTHLFRMFRKDVKKQNIIEYYDYYKNIFIYNILAEIKHCGRIYTYFPTMDKFRIKQERKMLNFFAHLSMIIKN